MQDQPQLETWIGASDVDTVGFAQLDGLLEVRMIVTVEHRPYLIAVLE